MVGTITMISTMMSDKKMKPLALSLKRPEKYAIPLIKANKRRSAKRAETMLITMVATKRHLGTWSEKNEIMWGKFPKGGEGSDPNPIHIFLCFFQFRSLLNGKKTVKKCEHSQTGGRGPPLGNFFHIILFFF